MIPSISPQLEISATRPVGGEEAVEKGLFPGKHPSIISRKIPCKGFVFHRDVAVEPCSRYSSDQSVIIDLAVSQWREDDVLRIAAGILGVDVYDPILESLKGLDRGVASDLVVGWIEKNSSRVEAFRQPVVFSWFRCCKSGCRPDFHTPGPPQLLVAQPPAVPDARLRSSNQRTIFS